MALKMQATVLANALKRVRPPVLPGTNAIINDEDRAAWFTVVNAAFDSLDAAEMKGAKAKEFFDLAGVPD